MRIVALPVLLALLIQLAPAHAQPKQKVVIGEHLARYRAMVDDPARFHPGNAEAVMKGAWAEIFALRPWEVNQTAIDNDPHGLVRDLMGMTLALDARMAEFLQQGKLTPAIANAKRRVLRGIRYLRESVLLRTLERAPGRLYEHGRPRLADNVPGLHWSVNPTHRSVGLAELPRTFLLLCMGKSNVSAAIARSADEDNTFSHLAIGYRSTEAHTIKDTTYPAGTFFVVESLIETGVILQPIAEHFSGIDRDVLFVVRDASKQAAIDAAADAFFARAKHGMNTGKPLGYDFSMGGGTKVGAKDRIEGKPGVVTSTATVPSAPDPDAYFCSAIGEEIFAKAGLNLFGVRTKLNSGANSGQLFASWGIDPNSPVPAPGDVDVSGVLLRVAEAAKLENLEVNYLRQAALFQIFKWMDEDNYQLRTPLWLKASTKIMSGLNKAFDLSAVPNGTDSKILRSFYALGKASDLYYESLAKDNQRFKTKHGRSMTPPEMLARLDATRDSVKGADTWLRRRPWAQGRYALQGRERRQVELLVVRASSGVGFSVRRTVLDRRGRLLDRIEGSARQRGNDLEVRYERETAYTPRRVTYRLKDDGRISGSANVQDLHDDHGPRNRRISRGKKIKGPVH